MTIQEALDLIENEEKGVLKMPHDIKSDNWSLCTDIMKLLQAKTFFKKRKMFNIIKNDDKVFRLEKNFIKYRKSKGCYTQYHIETQCGEGDFCKFSDLITTSFPLPDYQCYSNALKLCMRLHEPKTRMQTGVMFVDGMPYLHSIPIIDVEDKSLYIDSLFKMAMSVDLYQGIFNFQPLNEIDGQKVRDDHDLRIKYSKFCKAQNITESDERFYPNWQGIYAFADEDVMRHIRATLGEQSSLQ